MALTLENFKSVFINALSRSNPTDGAGEYIANLINNRESVILSKLYNSYSRSNQSIVNNTAMSSYSTVDDTFVIKFNGTEAEEYFEKYNITSFCIDNETFIDGNVDGLKAAIYNYISEKEEPYDLEDNFLKKLYFTPLRSQAPFDLYYGTDTQRVIDNSRNRGIYVKATGPAPYTDIYFPVLVTGWTGSTSPSERSSPVMTQGLGFPDMPISAQLLRWTTNQYNVYQKVGGATLSKPITGLCYAGNSVKLRDSSNQEIEMFIWREEDFLQQLRWLGVSRIAYTEEQATTWAYEDLPDTGTDEAPYEEPTQTETGQSENVVLNTGGTGDRTSDDISDYNPRNPAGAAGTGGSVYALNWKQMELVRAECWNTDFIEMIKSLNNNPASSIISCQLYPLDLSEFSGVLPKDTPSVVLGSYKINFSDDKFQKYGNLGDVYIISSINGVKATITENYKLDGIYGSFLDFEPYTKMKIYLPYVGLKEISPQHVFNKTLKIYYNIDIATGMCKAIIESDGIRIYEWKADIAVDISLSSSTFGSIKQNAVLGSIGAAVSIGSAVATGGMSISGLMDSGAGEMVSTVKNSLGAFSTSTTGSTGSSLERMDPQGCYLLIEYVESAVPTGYNHTYGRPSLITTTLNTEEMKGYCEIADSHFEIPNATESEKNEIENIFKEGVIIR